MTIVVQGFLNPIEKMLFRWRWSRNLILKRLVRQLQAAYVENKEALINLAFVFDIYPFGFFRILNIEQGACIRLAKSREMWKDNGSMSGVVDPERHPLLTRLLEARHVIIERNGLLVAKRVNKDDVLVGCMRSLDETEAYLRDRSGDVG